MTLTFFVPGKPQPGGSKRAFVVKGKAIITDANKNAKGWQQDVKAFAYDAMRDRGSLENATRPLLDGPLRVRCVFTTLRPQVHYRQGKNAGLLKDAAPKYPTGKPDCTKLWRSTEDALTGVVWKDDAQIVHQTIEKA